MNHMPAATEPSVPWDHSVADRERYLSERHLLEYCFCVGGGQEQALLLAHVERLLESGTNPHVLNRNGDDCMRLATFERDIDHPPWPRGAVTIARLLIEHGFNPIERNSFSYLSGAARQGALEALEQRARDGHVVRGLDGSHVLHSLAQHQLATLWMLLDASDHEKLEHLRAMVREPRKDGAHPIHVLWYARDAETFNLPQQGWRWSATLALLAQGATLGDLDAHGRSVADLIRSELSRGMARVDDMTSVGRALVADLQTTLLDRHTPRLPATAGRGQRL